MKVLATLTEEDLTQLGFTSFGHRRKLLIEIERLKVACKKH